MLETYDHGNQVFAALDVHTSKWIIEKCFGGELVRGRTVLLAVSILHNAIAEQG